MQLRLNDTEARELHVPVYASFEGAPDDLSAIVVQFGVSSSPTEVPTTWYTGAWLLEYGVWIANIVTGVGQALPLSVGNQYIWIDFTHVGNIVQVQVARISVVQTT